MRELIPAILAHDEAMFRSKFAVVEQRAPVIHIDVMDGAFVPNTTWHDPSVLKTMPLSARVEFHLMVKQPARYIKDLFSLVTPSRFIWHVEATLDHLTLVEECHTHHTEAGLAICPSTPLEHLAPYASSLDEILVMGAEPGFSGQQLQPHTIDRAHDIHARWPTVPLGFDIGVNEKTIPILARAGVTRFCAASAIFHAASPRDEFQRLQSSLEMSS